MKKVDKILGYFLAAIVAMMVIGCTWQVITRFVLRSPSKYTEEFLRYALIWLTMLGSPFAYSKNRHLAITFLTDRFNAKSQKYVAIFVDVLVLLMSLFIFVIGGIMVTMNSAGQTSAALGMPMQFYYICMPIGGVLCCIYSVQKLIEQFRGLKEEQ